MVTPDSQVLILLTSFLGLAREPQWSPLTLREWNALKRKMQAASWAAPEELLKMSMDDLRGQLDLPAEQAVRISSLLERGEAVQGELARLSRSGVGVLTRADPDYPQRYGERLGESAPTVLFYAGEAALLGQPGIAVVGSRHLDPAGQACAEYTGNACGLSGMLLYSGGARGVDTLSMEAALQARGSAVGILADSLEKAVRSSGWKPALERGDLCLVTPYSPNAGFSVGAAMGRNRLIYCLADYAIVVASDAEKGGTWAGATEALKAGWLPVFVLEHTAMPEGNHQLIKRGGIPFPHPFPEDPRGLLAWLEEHSDPRKPQVSQLTFF